MSKYLKKKLTLLGMSGIGKTKLAKLLAKENNCFHYSGDYRIGSEYLNDKILENIKNRIKKDTWLKDLLIKKSIVIKNNITFDNLSPVSSFLGKVGNPELEGLPLDVFIARQKMHKQAEIKTMLDVPEFIKKAEYKNYDIFINDAGGSLCELDDEKIYQVLAENTTIVYIKANEANEANLIKNAINDPKPLYYNPSFLKSKLDIYLKDNGLTYVAQINPNDFVRWIFPLLLSHRKPKYYAIAKKYGCIVESKELHQCKNSNEVFELINGVIK